MTYTKKHVGHTKHSVKAGSNGGGKAMPVQLAKAGTPHGRDMKAAHPDRNHNMNKGNC